MVILHLKNKNFTICARDFFLSVFSSSENVLLLLLFWIFSIWHFLISLHLFILHYNLCSNCSFLHYESSLKIVFNLFLLGDKIQNTIDTCLVSLTRQQAYAFCFVLFFRFKKIYNDRLLKEISQPNRNWNLNTRSLFNHDLSSVCLVLIVIIIRLIVLLKFNTFYFQHWSWGKNRQLFQSLSL